MTASKSLVDFLLGLVQAVLGSMDNGKFSYKMLFALGKPLMGLPDVLNNFKAAVLEIENADDAGRAELNAYIKSQFSLEDKGLEAKIEAAVSLVIKLSGLGDEIKTLLKKSPAAQAAVASAVSAPAVPALDPSQSAPAPDASVPAADPAPIAVDTVNVAADQVNVQAPAVDPSAGVINPAAGV